MSCVKRAVLGFRVTLGKFGYMFVACVCTGSTANSLTLSLNVVGLMLQLFTGFADLPTAKSNQHARARPEFTSIRFYSMQDDSILPSLSSFNGSTCVASITHARKHITILTMHGAVGGHFEDVSSARALKPKC